MRTSDTPSPAAPRGECALIGRHSLVELVIDELEVGAVVCLVGAAGVGKTRLSLVAASGFAARKASRTWHFTLRSTTHARLLLRSLPEELERARRLGIAPCLVIIDGCDEAAEQIASLVAGGHEVASDIRWMLVSREPLRLGYGQVLRVPGLQVPDAAMSREAARQTDAVALVLHCIQSLLPMQKIDATVIDVAIELARRLGGVPRQLQIGAAQMCAEHAAGRPLADCVTGARSNPGLSGKSPNTLARTENAPAVSRCEVALTPTECVVLRRLRMLGERFDLESAVDAIADSHVVQVWDVIDSMAALIDKSLIDVDILSSGAAWYSLPAFSQRYADELARKVLD